MEDLEQVTEEGKIILYREQQAPNGMDGFSRLTFYDLSEKGYRWIGEWVDKTEKIVYPTWKIKCTKIKNPESTVARKEAIQNSANAFSKAVMDGDIEGIMAGYTEDAKIFPNNRNILSGGDLKTYWTPRNNGYKTIHHKITPQEIKFLGDYAHDYGVYEGKTQKPDGTVDSWQGKYVVVWKQENGSWKMYLDIWNATPFKPKS